MFPDLDDVAWRLQPDLAAGGRARDRAYRGFGKRCAETRTRDLEPETSAPRPSQTSPAVGKRPPLDPGGFQLSHLQDQAEGHHQQLERGRHLVSCWDPKTLELSIFSYTLLNLFCPNIPSPVKKFSLNLLLKGTLTLTLNG